MIPTEKVPHRINIQFQFIGYSMHASVG
jgi:hypothetical protein